MLEETENKNYTEEELETLYKNTNNAPPPKTLNVIFTEYTNTQGDLNKTFSIATNSEVVKSSNAHMKDGKAKVVKLDTLTSFDTYLNNLKSNQAIGLGIPVNDITEATICKKGEEDISTNTISRTKEYQQWNKGRALCLFDYDPEEAMHDRLKVNSADELRNLLINIIPQLADVEMMIRTGSSYGVKNQNGECVSCKQSYHVYFEIVLDGSEYIKNLIEYFLRASVQQGLHYLKIFKDARSELRTAIDLSVLKSAESRLIFEAAPTCKDGLYQERELTRFYNQDSSKALDIRELNYTFLPNWKEEQDKLREHFKHKISQIKKLYQEEQIAKFLANGLSKKEALEKFKLTYENLLILVDEIVTLNDDSQQNLISLVSSSNESVYTKDIYEPQKGTSKAIISPRSIFDATYYTYLRGGLKYSIYFSLEQIKELLTSIIEGEIKKDLNKVIRALIMYCINNNFSMTQVNEIDKLLVDKADIDTFYQRFIRKDTEVKSMAMLKDHSVLAFGGNVGIINTNEIVLEDYSEQAMKTLYKNKLVHGKNPVNEWLAHKDRKEYHKVVFAPDGKTKPFEYNVFKGFKYEPKRNDKILEPFYDLVFNVICNGDQFMYGLVWAWMSDIIQNPASKMGTALVLRGKKGAGKGSFASIFGKLLGEYFFETADKKRIFGEFNAHLTNTLVAYLNEAFWSGDKTAEGKLKNLITDVEFTYEIKQGAVFSGKNYTHLIIDSNYDRIVPDGPDERRFINLDVSSCRLGNNEYFDTLHELSNKKEFLEALMFALSTYDYSAYIPHLRRAPKTAMSREQLIYNLDPIPEWWLHCLHEGEIPNARYENKHGESLLISNNELFESFQEYMKSRGQKVYDSSVTFGQTFVGKVVSEDMFIHKNTKTREKKSGKWIKSLNECRADFCNRYRLDKIESAIDEWSFVGQVPSVVN